MPFQIFESTHHQEDLVLHNFSLREVLFENVLATADCPYYKKRNKLVLIVAMGTNTFARICCRGEVCKFCVHFLFDLM